MLEAWVLLAIGGAFFQNLRSALQKHLGNVLSGAAAAYTRFLYALPFALLYLAVIHHHSGTDLPTMNRQFLLYCLAGGVAQILFTVLLLKLFTFKSFAVGTTLSKLEVVVVALLSALVLGDRINSSGLVAITLCTAGVVAITMGQNCINAKSISLQQISGETLVGLTCAFFLGASVVFFRGASLALQHDNTLLSAALTLVIALSIQTVLMGAWLCLREPQQWQKLLRHWKWAGITGAAGMLASVGWFTAFSLQNASYVRAVGTIELLFTYLFSTGIFKEQVTDIERIGMILIISGILTLLLL